MNIYCEGKAIIKHQITGVTYEIESDELDWQAVDGDEGGMGPRTHYQAEVEHPHLGELKWNLWEYSTGAQEDENTDVGPHQLISDLVYRLEHEEPDPEE